MTWLPHSGGPAFTPLSNVRYRANRRAVFRLTSLRSGGDKWEYSRSNLPMPLTSRAQRGALPASAGNGGNAISSKPEITLVQLDLCAGPCLGTDSANVVTTIAATTIGAVTVTIGANIETEPVVTSSCANGATPRL